MNRKDNESLDIGHLADPSQSLLGAKAAPFKGASSKSSAHGSIGTHRGSSKSHMTLEEKPIMYEGKQIKTFDDLLANFHLESFQETMAKKAQIDPETGKSMDKTPLEVDDEFLKLVHEARPKGEYYEHSRGDKLLYLKRVDKLRYDVYEAEEQRKAKKLNEELIQLKLERERAHKEKEKDKKQRR